MKNLLITLFFMTWITGLFFGYRHVMKKFAAPPTFDGPSPTEEFYATIKDKTRDINQRAKETIRRQKEFIESRRSLPSADPQEIQQRYRDRMDALNSRVSGSRRR